MAPGVRPFTRIISGAKMEWLMVAGGQVWRIHVEGDYSLEAKLQAMDDAGVDAALLRTPGWQEWPRLDTCKLVNDITDEQRDA
ncbi:MAG: hypothetical protein JW990_05180, partial [Thermoleophilia bacterium]|nr:hypothetical protein [Thermoleophilia bacterium]